MMTIQEIRSKLSKMYSGLAGDETKELIDSIMVYLNNYSQDSTIDLRTSSDWKARVLGEYKELKARTEKLHKTLVKWDAGTVKPKCNSTFEVLQTQYKHMMNYLVTLEVRMELEGIGY